MASVAARGSIGSAQRDEGRMALVACKLTAIACRCASLDKGTLTGVYVGPPTVATRSLFLPFPFVWGFVFLDLLSWSTVRILAKPTNSSCLADASSRLLVDGHLRLPSAANAAPPALYLANSLSSPYFKYANTWM